MGRTFLWVVAALVLGTVIGAWQPRAELLDIRGELTRMEKETRSCKRGAAASGIAEILRGDGRGRGKEESADNQGQAGSVSDPSGPRAAAAAEPEGVTVHVGDDAPSAGNSPLPDNPAAMADALDARAAQARAALIEQAEPDEAQLAAMDAAVDKMNQKLKTQVDAFVAAAADGREPDRREMMEFGAEALDAVIEADDAFRDALPAEVRADVDDEALDPFSFIEGETVAALAQLQREGE